MKFLKDLFKPRVCVNRVDVTKRFDLIWARAAGTVET